MMKEIVSSEGKCVTLVRHIWRSITIYGVLLVAATTAFVGGMVTGWIAVEAGDVIWVAFALCLMWSVYLSVSVLRLKFARQKVRYLHGDRSEAFSVALPQDVESLAAGETVVVGWTLTRLGQAQHVVWLVPILFSLGSLLSNEHIPDVSKVAGAVLLFGFSILPSLGNFLPVSHVMIMADDVGLHLFSARTDERIWRWDEIMGMLRGTTRDDAAHSGYLLLTQHEVISLELYPQRDSVTLPTSGEAYQMQVARLLKTLAARSARPEELGFLWRGKLERASKLTIEDAAALPIAYTHLQPQVGDANPLKDLDLPLTFGAIPDWGRIWRNGLVQAFIFIALLAAVFFTIFGNVIASYGQVSIILGAAFSCVILVLFIPAAVLRGRESFRRRYPHFLIQEDGLALNYRDVRSLFAEVVPWAAFGAWTVEELPKSRKVYTLYALNTRVSWMDDGQRTLQGSIFTGDRQSAYRVRMAQLHATIAARTGLVLREEREETRNLR